MSTKRKILVTGATGLQGGAVARHLAARGHAVRALTRRPDTPLTRALIAAGAEVVCGDLEDRASLDAAVAGMDAVFAVATPFERGVAAETRQIIRLVDAAVGAGVSHFLYSSVAAADQGTGIPHFESKAKAEEHLRSTSMPWTIVAPVFFMENLIAPVVARGLLENILMLAIPRRRKLQMIAVSDIAEFSALALEEPERFAGQRVEIAGEERRTDELAEVVGEALGRRIHYLEQPLAMVHSHSRELGTMFEWLAAGGFKVDIPTLHQSAPEVSWHSLESWAESVDWGRVL